MVEDVLVFVLVDVFVLVLCELVLDVDEVVLLLVVVLLKNIVDEVFVIVDVVTEL